MNMGKGQESSKLLNNFKVKLFHAFDISYVLVYTIQIFVLLSADADYYISLSLGTRHII